MAVPETVRVLHRFLETINYVGKFIPNLTTHKTSPRPNQEECPMNMVGVSAGNLRHSGKNYLNYQIISIIKIHKFSPTMTPIGNWYLKTMLASMV